LFSANQDRGSLHFNLINPKTGNRIKKGDPGCGNRSNALFAGSAVGGTNWAILASLINSAKLHELDPQAYLADVLERIVSGRTKVNALHELLPWNWKAARAAQDVKAAA
jgi:hypothetical protein